MFCPPLAVALTSPGFGFDIFALAAFAAPTRASALDEAVDVDISPAAFDDAYYLQPSLKKARELLSPT